MAFASAAGGAGRQGPRSPGGFGGQPQYGSAGSGGHSQFGGQPHQQQQFPQQQFPQQQFPQQQFPQQRFPGQQFPGQHSSQQVPQQHFPNQQLAQPHRPQQQIPPQFGGQSQAGGRPQFQQQPGHGAQQGSNLGQPQFQQQYQGGGGGGANYRPGGGGGANYHPGGTPAGGGGYFGGSGGGRPVGTGGGHGVGAPGGMNTAGAGSNSQSVFLSVYDLNQTMGFVNEWAKHAGTGVYHVGVEVFGKEYSYGATPERAPANETGICISPHVRKHEYHVYRRSEPLGETRRSEREVAAFLRQHEAQWRGSDYNIMKKNCIDFAVFLVDYLGVKPVPNDIRTLPTGANQAVGAIDDLGRQFGVENAFGVLTNVVGNIIQHQQQQHQQGATPGGGLGGLADLGNMIFGKPQ